MIKIMGVNNRTFPDPVCPYAMILPLNPSSTSFTRWLCAANILACVESSSNIWSKVNSCLPPADTVMSIDFPSLKWRFFRMLSCFSGFTRITTVILDISEV